MLGMLVLELSETRGKITLTRRVTGDGYMLIFEEPDGPEVDKGIFLVDRVNAVSFSNWLVGWADRLRPDEMTPPLFDDVFESFPGKGTKDAKRMSIAMRIEDGLRLLVCPSQKGDIQWFITLDQIETLAEEVRQFFQIVVPAASPA